MIVIDAITYNVPVKSVSRKADTLYKYAERTESGKLQAEMIGVFFNYDLVMEMEYDNVSAYNDLYDKLTEPTEFHDVTMFGVVSEYYFANIKDELIKDIDNVQTWRELSFSVIARSPSRVP